MIQTFLIKLYKQINPLKELTQKKVLKNIKLKFIIIEN